jgi:hypothetical protein
VAGSTVDVCKRKGNGKAVARPRKERNLVVHVNQRLRQNLALLRLPTTLPHLSNRSERGSKLGLGAGGHLSGENLEDGAIGHVAKSVPLDLDDLVVTEPGKARSDAVGTTNSTR